MKMKIIGFSSIAKPPFFKLNGELHAFYSCKHRPPSCANHWKIGHNGKKTGPVTKLQYSMSSRTFSSSSVDLSSSKASMVSGVDRQKPSTSLYTHPSLSEMRNERIANRAMVYDFLQDIGIVPDELDGLELPVTVDVMRERVDFLHKLGFTVEDINNYPLVLGCSVKKNMVPVLDYLGKLGVRKSSLSEFLRRYPQVLHASVVVDLAPVVKYLQGMDIQPSDIPRVLERYPEILGFKLEGTMSTSVAYLVGIGVSRREIGGVLTRYPEILGMRVARTIKPFVEYLESLGIPKSAVARLIERSPHILGFALEERVKYNVNSLLDFNVRQALLASVVAEYPEIIGIDIDIKLRAQLDFLGSAAGLSLEDFGRVVEKMPQILSLGINPAKKRVDFLKKCGCSLEQVRKMIVGCPQLLALNLDIMKRSFDYFEGTMRRPLDDLVSFPAFFTYGLESTIKPRHNQIANKGWKCSLSWLLNCSDERFEERMAYDSVGMEELEVDSYPDPSALMYTRSDESDPDEEDSNDD